jgi:hypothetical protein
MTGLHLIEAIITAIVESLLWLLLICFVAVASMAWGFMWSYRRNRR